MEDAMECLISFSDFLYAFQVQLYYEGTVWMYSVGRIINAHNL